MWNAHNAVFFYLLEELGYLCSFLFTSCIRLGLVSLDSIVDHHWLPATDVSVSGVPSTDVQRPTKFGGYVSCTERTGQGNDFELIPVSE